jgi:hypothetical protein
VADSLRQQGTTHLLFFRFLRSQAQKTKNTKKKYRSAEGSRGAQDTTA